LENRSEEPRIALRLADDGKGEQKAAKEGKKIIQINGYRRFSALGDLC